MPKARTKRYLWIVPSLDLSKDDLVALVLTQAPQIGTLTARIAALEVRLNAPPKTLDNSSAPPSKGQKPNRPTRPKTPRIGRPGVARALTAHLARAKAPLLVATAPIATAPIAAAVRASAVVGSNETSARVAGKTCWQWVLLSSTAICHVIAATRAAAVVTTFMDGVRPQVRMADRYGGQLGHGVAR